MLQNCCIYFNIFQALDEVQKGDLSTMDIGNIVQEEEIYLPNERPKKIIQKDTTDYDYNIDSDNENPENDDEISMAEISGDDDDDDDQSELDVNEK